MGNPLDVCLGMNIGLAQWDATASQQIISILWGLPLLNQSIQDVRNNGAHVNKANSSETYVP